MIFLPYISSYVLVFSSGGHFANWGVGETNQNNKNNDSNNNNKVTDVLADACICHSIGLKKNIILYKVLRISLCNKGGFSSCSGDCFLTVLVRQTVKISSYI